MLINNKIFETVGLMDEKMFMYFDDTDFCARLNLAGVKIKYVPKSIVWHKVSSSAGGSNSKITVYYNNRNQLYYMKKYKKMISRSTTIKVIVKGILKSLLGRFRNRPNDKYIAVGYVDYIKGNMGRKDF
jgi:GT2 family glycosyltransferase